MCSSFNPRPRTGGDGEVWSEDDGTAWFQSTPPHGGRPDVIDDLIYGVMFQSTPPHGGRHNDTMSNRVTSCFNPRPRTGGDKAPYSMSTRYSPFQSTPPHGGRQSTGQGIEHVEQVSIHAPARGATKNTDTGQGNRAVSIHAPARGATFLVFFAELPFWVSIHAPARGATYS